MIVGDSGSAPAALSLPHADGYGEQDKLTDGDDAPVVAGCPTLNVAHLIGETKTLAIDQALARSTAKLTVAAGSGAFLDVTVLHSFDSLFGGAKAAAKTGSNIRPSRLPSPARYETSVRPVASRASWNANAACLCVAPGRQSSQLIRLR
jgi:hypothetical protein